jgi:hypothetical protein
MEIARRPSRREILTRAAGEGNRAKRGGGGGPCERGMRSSPAAVPVPRRNASPHFPITRGLEPRVQDGARHFDLNRLRLGARTKAGTGVTEVGRSGLQRP